MIIFSQEKIPKNKKSIFLAGPTPRVKHGRSWRPRMIIELESYKEDINIFVPEFKKTIVKEGVFEKDIQIEWEHEAMKQADIILFWIPRDNDSMLGLTTNDEFGYWKCRAPEKIVLGVPKNSFRTDYQIYWANKLGIPVFNTMKEIAKEAIRRIK